MVKNTPARRGLFLLPGAVALLAGLDAALLLLGLPAPVTVDRLPDVHGPLMVLGFVGTVVALERAVALGSRLGYLAPAASGAGALTLLSPAPLLVGQGLLALGALALLGVYAGILRRQDTAATVVQVLGALCALAAVLLWAAGVPVNEIVPWLVGFLVLTIAGERAELARVGFVERDVEGTLFALACAFLASATATLLWPQVGYRLLGLTLLAVVGLLAVYDVARRTIRSLGLPRYVAACLLIGYAWLGVAGLLWLVNGPITSGRGYDAVLHAVFLGFVLTMIMAHAPVILPAVLRVPLRYRPVMAVPVALLQVTLVLRVAVGDAADLPVVVQVAGVGNIVSVLGFVLVAVWCAARKGPADPASPARAADSGPAPTLRPTPVTSPAHSGATS